MKFLPANDETYAAARLGQMLKAWRRHNNMKQEGLASLLGVSQPTIARWERGNDPPSADRVRQIRSLLAGTIRDELAIERLFISRQTTMRALIEIDGMRVTAFSRQYRTTWPAFSDMSGRPLADHLVNETRLIVDDADLYRDIKNGRVALASGVSERHVDIDIDSARLHQWVICFRRFGSRMFADMVFEPCAEDAVPGITELVHLDTLGDAVGWPTGG